MNETKELARVEVEVEDGPECALVEVDQELDDGALQSIEGVDLLEQRDALVKQRHKLKNALIEKVAQDPSYGGVEALICAVIEELVGESNNLLGNELLMMKHGQVDKASVVSVKHSDVLDILSKVAIRKRDILSSAKSIDFNSAAFQIFQALCFEKLVSVLEELNLDSEMRQLVSLKWADKMEGWDKELRDRMDNLEV